MVADGASHQFAASYGWLASPRAQAAIAYPMTICRV